MVCLIPGKENDKKNFNLKNWFSKIKFAKIGNQSKRRQIFRVKQKKHFSETLQILFQNVGGDTTRDRCYDFKNIFAEKFSENIGVFDSKQN
jgi:hypothetical protein